MWPKIYFMVFYFVFLWCLCYNTKNKDTNFHSISSVYFLSTTFSILHVCQVHLHDAAADTYQCCTLQRRDLCTNKTSWACLAVWSVEIRLGLAMWDGTKNNTHSFSHPAYYSGYLIRFRWSLAFTPFLFLFLNIKYTNIAQQHGTL